MNDSKNGMTGQEYFLRAHALYGAKEYDQALKTYQSIAHKGSATWYNMGNCAYQLGNYTDARIYWKRAQRDAFGIQRADILYNIQALDKKIGIDHASSKKFTDYGIDQINAVQIIYLQLFFLIGWIGLWAYVKRWHTKERYLILWFLIALNCFVGAALIYRFFSTQKQIGIVVSQATVYAGPDSRYHSVGTINVATECKIDQVHGNWCKVKSGSLVGWVKKDQCEIV